MLSRVVSYWSSHLVNHRQLLKSVSTTINTINKASSVTLGPMGRLVAIQSQIHQPRITKDGVTVVKHLEFQDRLQNAIASLVKSAADNANKYSGDGTTTTMLLACEIVQTALRMGLHNHNQSEMRQGFEIAKNAALEFFEEIARKAETLEDLYNVAMIATNSDKELSSLVSQALFKSEQVKVQKDTSSATSQLQYTSGFKLTRGLPNQLLINKINKLQFNFPIVLVTTLKLDHIKQILPVLDKAKLMRKQLAVFAPDISESVASVFYYNHSKKILESCPIRVPGFGDFSEKMLEKIAKMTGSYLFTPFSEKKLENIGFDDFGKCIKMTVDQFQTTIISKYTQGSRSCVIKIGSPTDVQSLQLYDKAVDALNSVRSAQRQGIVPGGGISYLRASQLLHSFPPANHTPTTLLSIKCISQSLKAPLNKLLQLNQMPFMRQTTGWSGYDFKTNTYVDMYQAGIVDSLPVVRNCVIEAVTLAGLLLSLEKGVVRDWEGGVSRYGEFRGKYKM